ncbi:hypothetical protein CJF32_00010982 [Rutstroemia sp. NJR-2017a WRK4]|nr:hypothetical protein CJF32_00010982 [Rutstroemia sp. NJR-2017a WRK4]
MGRLESLTAWALGRTPYEDLLIQSDIRDTRPTAQQYDQHGHPRNPETKRRERENVRAANEVMQATGIVEDLTAVRRAARAYREEKDAETYEGLKLMETERAIMVAGVWGVLGFRRRVLLYKSYSEVGVLALIRQERARRSLTNIAFSGLPAVDVFASSRIVPPLGFFIPFSKTSPFRPTPFPSANFGSILSWVVSIGRSALPMLMVAFHGKFKAILSFLLYRPIYKSLPRPKGESMFSGMNITAPFMEYDTPDAVEETTSVRSEDEQTLRALEGLPALERTEARPRRETVDSFGSNEDDDADLAQPTLISFDVDDTAATVVEPSYGSWSAELRSANEPPSSSGTKYRITGLTMLPIILAAEGLKDLCAAVVAMPIEQAMLRLIVRAYGGTSTGGLNDIYNVGFAMPSGTTLFAAYAFQLVASGAIWAGFTLATEWLVMKRKKKNNKRAKDGGDDDGPFV